MHFSCPDSSLKSITVTILKWKNWIRAPRLQLLWNNEEDENTEVATCGCRYNNSGRSQLSFYTYWLYLPALCGLDLFPPVSHVSFNHLPSSLRKRYFFTAYEFWRQTKPLKIDKAEKKRRVCSGSGFYSSWLLDPGVHFVTITKPLMLNHTALIKKKKRNLRPDTSLQNNELHILHNISDRTAVDV